jgi:carbon monoxide dehydrogenase subunit G
MVSIGILAPMEGTYSIDIQAPRQVVFEFLDDPDNLKKIVPNLVDAGIIQETPEKVGTTFWHVYEEKGRKMKMTGVVTEHQAPERMAVKLVGAFFRLEVVYRLEELSPDSTRVVQYSNARFRHVFKIMGLLFGKKMEAEGKKSQEENFARMKSLIESGSTD